MSLSCENCRQADEFSNQLADARHGSSQALGDLLQACRQYLLLIANEERHPALAAKDGASDLVQETLVAACRDFPRFRGATEAELLGWLRQILINHAKMAKRRYLDAQKRCVRREVSLNGHDHPQSTNGRPVVDPLFLAALAADTASPSRHFMRGELKAQIETAMARLPERYRQVIELRHRDNASFDEVAHHLASSPEAARQLWARAIKRLKQELGELR